MLAEQYSQVSAGRMQMTARNFFTGNTSLARRHLIASGGFDPTFQRAEDVELRYRLNLLGLQFLFNSDAIGYHYAERRFSSWLRPPICMGRTT